MVIDVCYNVKKTHVWVFLVLSTNNTFWMMQIYDYNLNVSNIMSTFLQKSSLVLVILHQTLGTVGPVVVFIDANQAGKARLEVLIVLEFGR